MLVNCRGRIVLLISLLLFFKCHGIYWSFQSRLQARNSSETFGNSPYAFSGRGFEHLISGYNEYDPALYVHTQDDGYAYPGRSVWTQQAKLVPNDPKGADKNNPSVLGDQFGYWMVSFNQTIIVSSPLWDLE